MKFGLGLGLVKTRGAPSIITAIIAPSLLAALHAGNDTDDIPAIYSGDMALAANYASTAGTIDTVLVEISVNGGAYEELPSPADVLAEDDTVRIRVTVTDTAANERQFTTNILTVGAPLITAVVSPLLSDPLYAGQDTDDIPTAYSANMGSTANYASTTAAISTAVVTISINGGAYAALPGSPVALSEDDTIRARITVTDAEANVRVFETNAITVQAAVSAYATSVEATASGGTTAQLAIIAGPVAADVYWFVSTSATPPSAANLKAGTGAVDFGTYAVSAVSTSFEGPSGLTASTLYYVYVLANHLGADSAIVSDSFTTEATDVTAPTLSSQGVTVLDTISADVYATTNEGRGLIYVVVSTVNDAPSASEIKLGQDGTGTTTDVKFSTPSGVAVSATGVQTITATGLTAVAHYAWLYHEDPTGNGSSVVATGAFTPADVTAPEISSLELFPPVDDTFSGTLNTDTGEGVLDVVLADPSNAPSKAQIKAGQNHLGATAAGRIEAQAVSAGGPQPFTGTATASGTYRAYAVHTDVAGNESDVLTGSNTSTVDLSAYPPDALFASSEAGGWWSARFAGSRWQDEEGGEPADAVDDPIGAWSTQKNTTDLVSTTDAKRPLYKEPAGLPTVDFDGADDLFYYGGNLTSGTWTLAFSYTPTAANFMVAFWNTTTVYLLPGQSGSSSTTLEAGSATINSIYFDGVLFSGTTRGQLYTAAQAAKTVIVDWTPGANWTSLQTGYFSATYPGTIGDLHGAILLNRSLTADERAAMNAWLTYEAGTDVAPFAFTAGMWTLTDPATAGDLTVTITELPWNGGDTITDIEYRVDGGSWTSSAGTGTFTISGLTDDVSVNVELRAVNAVGAGGASDVKAQTPTGASWAPSDLTLLMWIDASDTSTTFQDAAASTPAGVGNPVRRINDKANALHYLASSDAKRPTLQADGLDFDGTDDALASSAALDLSATDAITIFAVVERDTDPANAMIAELSPSGAHLNKFGLLTATTNYASTSRGSAAANANQTATSTTGYAAPNLAALIADHDISLDATNLYVNGTLDGTASGDKGTGNFDNDQLLYIGARGETSLYFNGRIAEIFIIGSVADSTIRSNAFAYFTAKWGT